MKIVTLLYSSPGRSADLIKHVALKIIRDHPGAGAYIEKSLVLPGCGLGTQNDAHMKIGAPFFFCFAPSPLLAGDAASHRVRSRARSGVARQRR